jgi:tryptophan halogenase
MSIPDTLRDRIQLFRDTAKVYREQDELFSEVAWVQIMIGQGVMPTDYHPMAAVPPDASFAEMMASVRTIVQKPLPHIGTHEEFLRRYCAAGSP